MLFIITYLIYDFNRFCIILDSKIKQEIYLQETNKVALENNTFMRHYKDWLITNAEIEDKDAFFRPLDFNTGAECCIYCCASFILFIIIFSFTLISIQGENAWIIAISIFLTIMILYPILRVKSDRKLYKQLDSEIKRFLYKEETGYTPLRNNRFTFKYRTWLLRKAREESRLESSV